MDKIEFQLSCNMCEEPTKFQVSKAGLEAWQKGKLIQHALPELSANQLEVLISGMCGGCMDKLFGGDDE